MNAVVGKDTVTLLNGGNYMYWKIKVKAILIRDDLWDVVCAPKPEVPTSSWQKQNNKAIALITLSVEDGQLLHIANCDTAFEMWGKLQKQYARSSFGSQLYLRRKLYGIRFTSGTMQTHINSMLEVVELLKGAGTEISTGELVAVLLCSLPESYSGLVTALEGRDEADLSIKYVTGKMLDEYQRRTEQMMMTHHWRCKQVPHKQPEKGNQDEMAICWNASIVTRSAILSQNAKNAFDTFNRRTTVTQQVR
uniref:DUF4219 domain-containing protein n=1 Tax=Trichuris muris TaxID=70415 RepID=A0A5S6PZB4_TRIMR